ncbi:MAG: GTPase [Candidatus Bathyarchaeia archaeon]
MPANLTAEAKAKWIKASEARNPRDKLRLLQEFLSSIPKHKGNERLRMQIKRKIASLKEELEAPPGKGVRVQSLAFERAGAALIPLLGYPNSGKSAILSALTKVKPKVSMIPFTTREPVAGILHYEDVQLQLVELPSIPLGLKLPSSKEILKMCDGVLLVVDASIDPASQVENMFRLLEETGITTHSRDSRIEINRTDGGGLRIMVHGTLIGCSLRDVEDLLAQYGVKNALVRLYGRIGIQDVEDAVLDAQSTFKPAMILLNKVDLNPELQGIFRNSVGSIPCLPISAVTGDGLGVIGERLFKTLRLIRVYTKEPGQREPSGPPFIFKGEATVAELARRIHSSFLENFKHARIWGSSSKYPGEKVGLDHKLCDGDTVEIRLR